MTTYYQPGLAGETLIGRGQNNTAVTAAQIAAGVVVIKAASGRLCQVLITTTTTAAQAITFYDNASAGSGVIIGIVPGAATAGTVYTFLMPADFGITIAQNASLTTGQITVSWS